MIGANIPDKGRKTEKCAPNVKTAGIVENLVWIDPMRVLRPSHAFPNCPDKRLGLRGECGTSPEAIESVLDMATPNIVRKDL